LWIHNEAESSPFFKSTEWRALQALDIITNTDLPDDYTDEEIIVEGTDEIRRRVNGYWQHKHSSHDYWHPIARIHKYV
jgi:hypothetical protein